MRGHYEWNVRKKRRKFYVIALQKPGTEKLFETVIKVAERVSGLLWKEGTTKAFVR